MAIGNHQSEYISEMSFKFVLRTQEKVKISVVLSLLCVLCRFRYSCSINHFFLSRNNIFQLFEIIILLSKIHTSIFHTVQFSLFSFAAVDSVVNQMDMTLNNLNIESMVNFVSVNLIGNSMQLNYCLQTKICLKEKKKKIGKIKIGCLLFVQKNDRKFKYALPESVVPMCVCNYIIQTERSYTHTIFQSKN